VPEKNTYFRLYSDERDKFVQSDEKRPLVKTVLKVQDFEENLGK
jgi:hypothetical protein